MSAPNNHFHACCGRRNNLRHPEQCSTVRKAWREYDAAVAERLEKR